MRRLEARFGVTLHRTTRSVTPTKAGRRLLERPDPAEVEAALDVVHGFRERPMGTLRLNDILAGAGRFCRRTSSSGH